jgi:hypothetical protein
MDYLVVSGFFSNFLMIIPPFIYVYVLSKRFNKYSTSRPYLFMTGLAFAIGGFILEALDVALGLSDIRFSGGLSFLNLLGTMLLLAAVLGFYALARDMLKVIDQKGVTDLSLLPLSAVLFSVFLFFSGSFVHSINGVMSFLIFGVLFYALISVGIIYRKIMLAGYYLVFASAILVSVQMFYQTYWFMAQADGNHALSQALYAVRLVCALASFLLAIFPCFYNAEKEKEASVMCGIGEGHERFICDVSRLIGGAALTILKNAVDGYNKENNTQYRFDPARGLNGIKENGRLMEYIADYFEQCIGPVARRLYDEALNGRRI